MRADPAVRRRRGGGFSLLELVLFIVIVGAGLAGVVSVLDLTSSKSADPMMMKQALAVGEAFVDEILSRDYSNPGGFVGPPTQANRSQFADVDDYHGYSQTGVYTRTGATPIPGLSGFSVSVSVAPSSTAIGSGANQVPAGKMKVITVTVTDPTGKTYPLSGFKADY